MSSKKMGGAESGRMPEGRRTPDHSGTKMPMGMGGSMSGSMPGGRKTADHSGAQVRPWKSNGEMC
jgi:hypothetical protein